MISALTLAIILAILVVDFPRKSLSSLSSRCDQDYCDSLVQTCKLNERCDCNFKEDVACTKGCIDCLEEKFGKCCSCIDGLCPTHEDDAHSSHVGDLSKTADNTWFEVLTEEDDIHGRWQVYRIPSVMKVSHPGLGQIEFAHRKDHFNSTKISHDDNLETQQCVVAFISRELSLVKCKKSCITMGASYFRWFHIGCCECVGSYCLNYGIDEPNCSMSHD